MGKYSIAIFYILAWTLGAAVIYLVVQGVVPSGLALASVLSASIAGILATTIEDGRAGLKLLLSRVVIWRAGIQYWLFAILFPVPAFLLGSLINPIFNGKPMGFSGFTPAFPILPMFIGFFIISGLGQELGWTGFLLPRLQSRFSALTSSILRAILVGVWHLPLLTYSMEPLPALEDFPYSGWIAQEGFLAALTVLFLMFTVPWSIFFTWIFNNSAGSLLMVSLLHGSEIWVAYIMMSNGMDPANLDNYWGYGAVLVLAAIIVVIITGPKDLSRRFKRIVHHRRTGK